MQGEQPDAADSGQRFSSSRPSWPARSGHPIPSLAGRPASSSTRSSSRGQYPLSALRVGALAADPRRRHFHRARAGRHRPRLAVPSRATIRRPSSPRTSANRPVQAATSARSYHLPGALPHDLAHQRPWPASGQRHGQAGDHHEHGRTSPTSIGPPIMPETPTTRSSAKAYPLHRLPGTSTDFKHRSIF